MLVSHQEACDSAEARVNDAVARANEAAKHAETTRDSLVARTESALQRTVNLVRGLSLFSNDYEPVEPSSAEVAEWVGRYTSNDVDQLASDVLGELDGFQAEARRVAGETSLTGALWKRVMNFGIFALILLVIWPLGVLLVLATVVTLIADGIGAGGKQASANAVTQDAARMTWQTRLSMLLAQDSRLAFDELGPGKAATVKDFVSAARDAVETQRAAAERDREKATRALEESERQLKNAVAALNSSSVGAMGPWGSVPTTAPAMSVDPGVLRLGRVSSPTPNSLDVPWYVTLSKTPSVVVICKDGAARKTTEAALGSAAIRAMSTFPPGYAKFTFVDLASAGAPFAAVVSGLAGTHLVSGGKTYVQQRDVEQALSKALDDVQQRLQTLGHSYKDLDDLNSRSPGRKLPRHFVMVNGFPSGMTPDQARMVATVVAQGGRCGVHALVSIDPGTDMSRYLPGLGDLPCTVLDVTGSDAQVRVAGQPMELRVRLDAPPSHELGEAMVRSAREGGRTASAVAISYDSLEREHDGSSAEGLRVPIGLDQGGAQVYLNIGDQTPHGLIQGRSGTGKSTLLHAVICGLAETYSPEELELYLLDMKAVEFRGYGPDGATPALPHAKVISANSDSEFGVAVLRAVTALLEDRKYAFASVGAQKLSTYRQNSGKSMPRVLIILDEFQRLFSDDLNEATESKNLLEQIAKEGRSFGIHMILATQIFKTSDLTRGTMEQATLRISLRCGEMDAVAMLGSDAAKLVTELGPMGEGVVQDGGENQTRNDIVRFALLEEDERRRIIRKLSSKYPGRTGFVLFEGDKPVVPWEQSYFATALMKRGTTPPRRIDLWLGRPVGVERSVAFALRRDPGRHLGLFGPDADIAVGSLLSCAASACAQSRPDTLELVLLNALRSDDPWGDRVRELPAAVAHAARNITRAGIVDELERLAVEIERRDPDDSTSPTILVLGFGMFNATEVTSSDKNLQTLIEKGADRGVHFVGWWRTKNDVLKQVESRRLDRIGGRVYFHVSADDAGALLPSGRLISAVSRMERNRAALLDLDEPDRVTKIVPFSAQERDMNRWTQWIGSLR